MNDNLEKYLKENKSELDRICRYLAASCAPALNLSKCCFMDLKFEDQEYTRLRMMEEKTWALVRKTKELESAAKSATATVFSWYVKLI